jgi:hypothetical protein
MPTPFTRAASCAFAGKGALGAQVNGLLGNGVAAAAVTGAVGAAPVGAAIGALVAGGGLVATGTAVGPAGGAIGAAGVGVSSHAANANNPTIIHANNIKRCFTQPPLKRARASHARIGDWFNYTESEKNCKNDCLRPAPVLYFAKMNAPDYFIPDRDPRAFYPLDSFLRAPSINVAAAYIQALSAPGDLVIDPFGSTPNVARAAHALGRRAIVVESNPLWAWLARSMATLPPAAEIDAALARLGDALKDDTPLRAHINSLYTTICAGCQKPTPADYFVHARGAGLIQRHYTCAHCGATRDDPAAEDDRKLAESFNARGLHYHLATERVAPAGNLHAERIRKMLDVYTPRNLSALVTLTQKIDSLFHATRERDILLLLLLHLLDRGTSFYATPASVAQLAAHKQFIEFNLWREIEVAAHALAQHAGTLALADSIADVSAANDAAPFVGRGSAKTLARDLPKQSAALVVAAPPVRRVAVWALAYLWGAWILGRAAVEPLIPFLDTQKDAAWEWRWYSDLLNDSMNALATLLRANARAVFAFGESWQFVIEALLLAAAGARLNLEAFLFQPRVGDFPRREFDDIRGAYRIVFSLPLALTGEEPGMGIGELEQRIRAAALAAGGDILARRGEALAYSWVHHAAYARAARDGLLRQALRTRLKTAPGRFVHNALVAGLSEGYAHDFDHYATPNQFVWLRRARELGAPLIDRVDDAVREILARGSIAHAELEDALYRQFPGDLTPEAGLVALCASAYADERAGLWHWRTRDTAAERARALELLARLGERLEYAVIADSRWHIANGKNIQSAIRHTPYAIRDFELIWLSDGEIAHGFVWRERAQFTDLLQVHIVPARGYAIVPENLIALLQEKTRRLPHLADAFHEAGWHFVRVPFVEKLQSEEKVERNDLALIAGLVPPLAEKRAQLELL